MWRRRRPLQGTAIIGEQGTGLQNSNNNQYFNRRPTRPESRDDEDSGRALDGSLLVRGVLAARPLVPRPTSHHQPPPRRNLHACIPVLCCLEALGMRMKHMRLRPAMP